MLESFFFLFKQTGTVWHKGEDENFAGKRLFRGRERNGKELEMEVEVNFIMWI